MPFCTSHSSGFGSSDRNLRSLESGAKWVDGRRFSGSESASAIRDWIDGLDLNLGTDVSNIRSLGLSNWYIEEIDDFIAQVDTMPALVQNEIHIYYQEREVVPYMHNLGIVMQAWYPFGGRGHTGEQFADQTIVEIARAHHVTPAQVILRWHLQRGVVAIPGSSNPAHIEENISVFHFHLTDEEMARIATLDRGEKHDWY